MILGAAQEVFLKEGYDAASMSLIASHLGGSKGTLYKYFRSKEELFEAFIRDYCACHVRAAFEQPISGNNPVSALAEWGECLLTALMSDEYAALRGLIVSVAGRHPAVGRAIYESGLKNGARRVADFLERAKTEGRIVADDCVKAAEALLSLLHGDLYRRRELNIIAFLSKAEIYEAALRAARTFIRAYGPYEDPVVEVPVGNCAATLALPRHESRCRLNSRTASEL